MNEKTAIQILHKRYGEQCFKKDNSIFAGFREIEWDVRADAAMLEGIFDADELEALAWWMHNKGENKIYKNKECGGL